MPEMETVKTKKTTKSSAPSKRSGGFVLREDCYRVLSENNVADPKREPKIAKEQLLKMYRNMARTRMFDERTMMLQRQGRIGFSVPSFGQEAIQTGTAAALKPKDWIFPSYREPGVWLYRGMSMYQMLCNLYGNRGDICLGRQMPVHYSNAELRLFSVSSPIATQCIQAVGAAYASKLRGESDISITYIGDGGTSENDFHTAMTFAGAMKTPTVIVCTNNQYAISVPVAKQCGAKRMVDKAVGYGMPGYSVDGNDVLAVYEVARQCVERARNGEGPSFIECLTLRIGPHSSSDDPTRYRDPALYDAWKARDPIVRFREYLTGKKFWNDKLEAELQEELKAEILGDIEKAEKQPPPELEELFTDVYEKPIPLLDKQLAALKEEAELRGKFKNTSEAFPL